MKLVIKIALGVVLAFVIMGTAAALIEMYAIQEMNESIKRKAIQEQERIKKQKETLLREQERKRLLSIKEQQQKEKARRIAWKKQQAWYAWYEKREPKGCKNWQSERHMVDCTNKKMDLKGQFEKVWNSQHNQTQK